MTRLRHAGRQSLNSVQACDLIEIVAYGYLKETYEDIACMDDETV